MANYGFTDTFGLGLRGTERLELLEGEKSAVEFEGEVGGVQVL